LGSGIRDPGSGIRDGKKPGSGIRDKHPGSATLVGRGYAVLWIRNKEKIGFGSGFDINFGTGSGLLMKNTLDFTLFVLKAQRIFHQNLNCILSKFVES
jgi:hypothetical protein